MRNVSASVVSRIGFRGMVFQNTYMVSMHPVIQEM